jgi:hypothetical protein
LRFSRRWVLMSPSSGMQLRASEEAAASILGVHESLLLSTLRTVGTHPPHYTVARQVSWYVTPCRLVVYHSTRRNMPGDLNLQQHRYENLKSCISLFILTITWNIYIYILWGKCIILQY